jgi:hypothetical protein
MTQLPLATTQKHCLTRSSRCFVSQEAASRIAKHRTLLATIKAIAASKEESSLSVRNMAIGAMNSLSRSERAVRLLNEARVVEDILRPVLTEKGQGAQHQLLQLTVTSALANLVAKSDRQFMLETWITQRSGQRAVADLAKCLGLALDDCRYSFCEASFFYDHS